MDRTAWIVIVLCVVGLIGYQWFYTEQYVKPAEEAARAAEEAATAASPAEADATASPTGTPATAVATPTATPAPTPEASLSARTEVLGGEKAEYLFNNDTGGIEQVNLLLHTGENEEAVALNGDNKMPIGALGFGTEPAAGGFMMTIDEAAQRALFEKNDSDGLKTTKVFRLPDENDDDTLYEVRMTLRFKNEGEAPVARGDYYVGAGSASPIHESDQPIYTRFDWFRDGDMSGIDVNWFPASSIPVIGIQTRGPRDLYFEQAQAINWSAVTSQYFATIITATEPEGSYVWARRFVAEDAESADSGKAVYGIQGALGFPGFTLEPGQELVREFTIFSGPKEYDRLKELGTGQQDVLRFGFFKPISLFLLWGMNTLYGFVHSYALAIILLTLIIKTLLWPLQNKATQSMKRMSLLSPKMTELREKYKDDPQKMNEELMKLYKEYKINPLGGCLPMLIQIPIFFGFYSMLGTAIELRNSSFLWINDLSQPDTVGYILGFPINLLPLLMAGTMVWQMAITPKTGDAMQQRVMMFLPVIFVVFAYNFASALSLYWTTQNLFSIVQLYLTRNQAPPELVKAEPAAPKKKPGSGGQPHQQSKRRKRKK